MNLPMSHRAAPFHPNHFLKSAALAFGMILSAGASTFAQDAIRPSLAGQDSYEARQEDVSRIPYNLMMGPVRFRVGATVGAEYNDNINYAEVHTQDGVIITPSMTLDAIWPVTQLNTLRFDLGLG